MSDSEDDFMYSPSKTEQPPKTVTSVDNTQPPTETKPSLNVITEMQAQQACTPLQQMVNEMDEDPSSDLEMLESDQEDPDYVPSFAKSEGEKRKSLKMKIRLSGEAFENPEEGENDRESDPEEVQLDENPEIDPNPDTVAPTLKSQNKSNRQELAEAAQPNVVIPFVAHRYKHSTCQPYKIDKTSPVARFMNDLLKLQAVTVMRSRRKASQCWYISTQQLSAIVWSGRYEIREPSENEPKPYALEFMPGDTMVYPDNIIEVENSFSHLVRLKGNEKWAQFFKIISVIPIQHELPIVQISPEFDFKFRKWSPPPPTAATSRVFLYGYSNIRHDKNTWAANCRHATSHWDEHPWCTYCLLKANIPICKSDDCYICKVMGPSARSKREERAQSYAKQFRRNPNYTRKDHILNVGILSQIHADYLAKEIDGNPDWSKGYYAFCRPNWAVPMFMSWRDYHEACRFGSDIIQICNHQRAMYTRYMNTMTHIYPNSKWDTLVFRAIIRDEETLPQTPKSKSERDDSRISASNSRNETKSEVPTRTASAVRPPEDEVIPVDSSPIQVPTNKRSLPEEETPVQPRKIQKVSKSTSVGTAPPLATSTPSHVTSSQIETSNPVGNPNPLDLPALNLDQDEFQRFLEIGDQNQAQSVPSQEMTPAGAQALNTVTANQSANAWVQKDEVLTIPYQDSRLKTDRTRSVLAAYKLRGAEPQIKSPPQMPAEQDEALNQLEYRVEYSYPISNRIELKADTILSTYARNPYDPDLPATIPCDLDHCWEQRIKITPKGPIPVADRNLPSDHNTLSVLQREAVHLDALTRANIKLTENDGYLISSLAVWIKKKMQDEKPSDTDFELRSVIEGLRRNLLQHEQLAGTQLGILTAIRRRDNLEHGNVNQIQTAQNTSTTLHDNTHYILHSENDFPQEDVAQDETS